MGCGASSNVKEDKNSPLPQAQQPPPPRPSSTRPPSAGPSGHGAGKAAAPSPALPVVGVLPRETNSPVSGIPQPQSSSDHAAPANGDTSLASHHKSTTCLDDYRIIKTLGKGSFAVVFQVERTSDHQTYAMKKVDCATLTDQEKIEILQEIDLLKSLSHPNIIRFIDCFEEDSYLYIIMEQAKIGDLAALIKKGAEKSQFLPEKTIWKLFYQIAYALKHMHDHRILHRDIKPANVFIDSGGKVQVGDLGLGRVFSSMSTAAYTLVGTPYYMSPERLNQLPYSFKSDVWSLGCVLYEMAALKSPFYDEKATFVSLSNQIARGEYPPLPDSYSNELKTLVAEILVVNPDDRPDMKYIFNYSKQQVEALVQTPR